MYTKPDTASATPYGCESRGVTPFANSTPGLTPARCGHTSTPYSAYTATPQSELTSPPGGGAYTPGQFDVGSGGVTPCSTCDNTPVHVYSGLSANATPTKTDVSSVEVTPHRDSDLTDHELVADDNQVDTEDNITDPGIEPQVDNHQDTPATDEGPEQD